MKWFMVRYTEFLSGGRFQYHTVAIDADNIQEAQDKVDEMFAKMKQKHPRRQYLVYHVHEKGGDGSWMKQKEKHM